MVPPSELDGYEIVPMTWTGVIEKGGPEMSFNGTISEVTEQIREIKRDFTWDSLRQDLGDPNPEMHKRSKSNLICNVGGDSNADGLGPYTANAQSAQQALAATSGVCSIGPGPRVCTVLLCNKYNAGIWLCNDNDFSISPNCAYLASYAQDIINQCGQNYVHGVMTTRGQEFDTDNYNVVVGWKWNCP
ncbi:hypothetical protein F5Y16DRAFT_412303 [Xylariaceae sp. FL0255]|nr:hypothetical protein F5Y16DRAFT_412303 [Xylariaceae sp. FL0255]